MFKLRTSQKPSASSVSASKSDHDIHQRALTALEHYYKHGDSGKLNRIVVSLPNSNRRVAMLEWLRKFSALHWDRNREMLVRKKIPEQQDIDGAKATPFWTFKIKQEQRRHVSGNTFDPDHFLDRVISDIKANIETISPVRLESAAAQLVALATEMREKRASNSDTAS